MSFFRVTALIALGGVSLYACASAPSNHASQPAATISVPPVTPPAPGDTAPGQVTRPPASAEPLPLPPPSASGNVPPPHDKCGCAPCVPIKSNDPCQSDADCAPSSFCHSPACIAKSKAPVRPPNVMCTMNIVCNTTDVGGCACVDNVCALVAR